MENDFTEVKEEDIPSIFENSNSSPMPSIFKTEENLSEENKKIKEVTYDKRIERIQLSLILILIVVGSLVYFFGYDLLKPFIPID